jgi:DNA repair protein RadC
MRKTIQHSTLKIPQVKLKYLSNVAPSKRVNVSSAPEAYDFFKFNWDKETIELKEELKVLLLNSAGHVLGILVASTGTVNATSTNIRIIFQSILLSNASAFVLCHNHPSGDLHPSEADVEITKKIKEAATLFEIQLLDHIIINSEDYLSFNDNGLL